MSPTADSVRLADWLESAWLARYLDRQLSPEESAWFESYVLDKPDLLTMIEVDTDMREGLAKNALDQNSIDVDDTRLGVPDASRDPETKIPAVNAAIRRMSWNHQSTWVSVAASLIVGFGMGALALRSMTPSNEAVMTSPTHVIFETMRGESTQPRVEHQDSNTPYALIDVAVPPGAHAILLQIGDSQSFTLTPSPDGFVSFLLRRDIPKRPDSITLSYLESDKRASMQIDPYPLLRRQIK